MKAIKNRSGAFILLCLFLAVSVVLFKGLKLDPHQVPSVLINKKIPNFSLPQLNSADTVTAQQWIGKTALVNVWASWCESCVEEHDLLMKIVQESHVTIYGLNYKDEKNTAAQWLQQHGNPYKNIALDSEGKTAIDWGVYGTPETFVIDAQGIIRYKQVGALTWDVWQKQIKPLLASLA